MIHKCHYFCRNFTSVKNILQGHFTTIFRKKRKISLVKISCTSWYVFDHVGGALVACALLKSLAHEAEKEVEIDLANDLMAHAK